MPTTNQQYIEDCHRTLSLQFEGANLKAEELLGTIQALIEHSNNLDYFKKALFYGKQTICLESAEHFGQSVNCQFGSINPVIIHGIIGKVTESIELLEALMNAVKTGQPLDLVNIKEEVGDGFWYDAILAKACGFTFEQAQHANIAKLATRYPEKFTSELAENRDLKTEREVLEIMQKHANENPMLLARENKVDSEK